MSLKDIDTFIQQFIQKCVQVIVQSRLGTERTSTKCKPNGKDWFNLDINDIKDIREQTNKCLKRMSSQFLPQSLYFIRKEWKICCEISLKNSDGISIMLEYWMFSNLPLVNEKDLEKSQNEKLSQLVYEIFIRMSNMIKSLIVLTRSTPAHRLSSKGQSADSYVICYRVYQFNDNFHNFLQPDQLSHYSPMKTIGVIKNHYNELSLSLIYRKDMNINSESEIKNLAKIEEKTYESSDDLLLSLKDDHFKSEFNDTLDIFDIIKPLNPAFATKESNDSDSDLNIPFHFLLPISKETSNTTKISNRENQEKINEAKSNPISIPTNVSSKAPSKSPQIYSTSNESFVFVELNAPFASDDSVLSSFFHGPSPTFVNNKEDPNDIVELSLQLAELESNAPQIDSFVESICLNEGEDFKLEA